MILLIAIATAQFILLVMGYRLGWRIYQRLGEMNRAPEIHAGVREQEQASTPAPFGPWMSNPEPPPGPVIWDILSKRHGEWVVTGKVREGTPAWEHAKNNPNRALRSPQGEFIEGAK